MTESISDANTSAEYPAEIVQKKFHPQYLYRLPGNEDMCFRFSIGQDNLRSVDYSIGICTSCFAIYRKHSKGATPSPYPTLRRFKNSTMENDPTKDHFDSCEPSAYDVILKEYHPIIEKNTYGSKFRFPLEKIDKTSTAIVIYRLKEDPSKCYRYQYQRKTGAGATVACSECIARKNNKTPWLRLNATQDGLLDDPRLQHLPGCSPLSYKEIMKKHILLDKEAKQKLIGACYDLMTEIAKKPNRNCNSVDTVQDDKDSHILAPGIGVIEAKTHLTYFYRIPNSNECLRFFVQNISKSGITLRCAGCSACHKKAKRLRGEILQKKARASDGCSMKENPLLDHVQECKPEIYSEIVKNYYNIDKDNNRQPQGEFPLVRMRKQGALTVIYRLEDDPTKCYVFFHRRASKSPHMFLQCSSCQGIKAKRDKKENADEPPTITHRLNEKGFLDDPCTGHKTECRPIDHETVMKTKEYVDKDRAIEFIRGNSDWHIKEKKTDFQVSVYQKRNSVYFSYQNPSYNSTYGYVFYQLNHNDNSQLFCATCHSFEDATANSNIIIRKADGFSMEVDPTINHLDHCKPKYWANVGRTPTRQVESGKKYKERKYEFCIDKISNREQYYAVHQLNSDPSRCYKFKSTMYAFKVGHLHVRCTQCSFVKHQNIRTEKNKHSHKTESLVAYRCTSSGFLDDPCLRHLPGCKPLQFEQIKKDYIVAGEEVAKAFFKHRYIETQANGIKISRNCVENTANKEHSDEEEDFSLIDNLNDENIDPLLSKKTQPTASLTYQVENEISDLKSERVESVVQRLDEVNKEEDLNMNNILPKTFLQTFEIPFFTQEEVEIGIMGRTLMLKCDRQISTVFAASCYLAYSFELPISVDISTIDFNWKDGRMTVTAEMK